MGFEKRVRVSVRGDKGQLVNTVESSKHPGTKGAIMDNKRCEITVALFGDTSDCSSIPDTVALLSPQYFVEAYALRNAYCEGDDWQFPLVLRFEESDVVVDLPPNESTPPIKESSLDECLSIKNAIAGGKSRSACPYLARIKSLDCCSGERLTAIYYLADSNSVMLTTENHAIRIC